MASKRNIGIFTGSRAEFGLLVPVIDAVKESALLGCSLFVSDNSQECGQSELIASGYSVASRIQVPALPQGLAATPLQISAIISSLVPEFQEISPEILLVYGDRFETFAAAIAASQMCIPVAQIEAGDRTDGGCLDDSVRHAITKLSHLFFTSNQEASKRVSQLGEEQWRIHNVGLTTLDYIHQGRFASVEALASEFSLDLNLPLILFTQHPVASEFSEIENQIYSSISALEMLVREDGAQVLITGANSDSGGDFINAILEDFAKKNSSKVIFCKSLGRNRYHGFLNWCVDSKTAAGVCVGNSSSGIKEAIGFGCPAVNIGNRQKGRLAPENVIHVPQDTIAIVEAIRLGLFDSAIRTKSLTAFNPYGGGDAGNKIAQVLSEVDMIKLSNKVFIDLN